MSAPPVDPVLADCFETDQAFSESKPTLLIYASCHGRTLIEYFRRRPDVSSRWNLIRLETGPMTGAIRNGVDVFERPATRHIFALADVIATYNMGARMQHHDLARVSKLFRPDVKVVTFVSPNFSVFWPFSMDGYGNGLGLYEAFDKQPKDIVWQSFVHGEFDPLFNIRWRIEIGRLRDRETYHDVGLAEFVARNHKKAKLWFGPSHPTFITMAFIGSQIAVKLGLATYPEEHLLGLDYMCARVDGQPETDYEFRHFGFEYPRRHMDDAGGIEYYRRAFNEHYDFWKRAGHVSPGVD